MGERQTEDLKVPGSIPGVGIFLSCSDRQERLTAQYHEYDVQLVTIPPDIVGNISDHISIPSFIVQLVTFPPAMFFPSDVYFIRQTVLSLQH